MPLVGRRPCAALRPFVGGLWIAEEYIPGSHRRERILPTGESGLIIDLREGGAAGFSGPHSESFVIDVASQFFVAGVQFTPGGALPFFDPPLAELANRQVPLDRLWGGLADELRDQVLASSSAEARLDTIERVLLSRLRLGRALHPAVDYAVRRLQRCGEPVGQVVRRIGMSHRRFLDLFVGQVGLTPKRFARVRRFQRVVQQVHAGRPVHWAEVALSCGYYDQAHFIREFAEFSGVNPTTYLAAAGPHANHVRL
jgi:AraC-like DNA-binding protein